MQHSTPAQWQWEPRVSYYRYDFGRLAMPLSSRGPPAEVGSMARLERRAPSLRPFGFKPEASIADRYEPDCQSQGLGTSSWAIGAAAFPGALVQVAVTVVSTRCACQRLWAICDHDLRACVQQFGSRRVVCRSYCSVSLVAYYRLPLAGKLL